MKFDKIITNIYIYIYIKFNLICNKLNINGCKRSHMCVGLSIKTCVTGSF
jgi:hypothetical protein